MAEENSFIFCQFNKIANHKWSMCANSAKATFLVSSDCTGSGRFHILVLGECFDHLLSAVTVNLKAPAEPRHPLLCLSVAAFKVHFMSLSRYLEPLYSIAQQPSPSPFQVLLYILCGCWSFALRVCLCASLIEWGFFCLCVRGCIKACKAVCSRCAYILEHVYMCSVHSQICVLNVGSGAATGMPAV